MNYTDSRQMKIAFIYELLFSIRFDFSDHSALKERHALALKLCKLSIKDHKRLLQLMKKNPHLTNSKESVASITNKINQLTILKKTIEGFIPGQTDGRYFRYEFPYGYLNLLQSFGLVRFANE